MLDLDTRLQAIGTSVREIRARLTTTPLPIAGDLAAIAVAIGASDVVVATLATAVEAEGRESFAAKLLAQLDPPTEIDA